MSSTTKKIRLGICMAGAVSAGAYTAGVIDYLIETLERWQQQKDTVNKKKEAGTPLTAEEALVPLHDVIIEVFSGASAGGMTAAVAGYSFNDGSYINRRNGDLIPGNYGLPNDTDAPSKLYNAWINMVDDAQSTTFHKLMDTVDVVSLNDMRSVLNSDPIDQIAEKAVPEKIDFRPPPYVSNQVSLILSVTNLEGVPIDIRFSNVDENDPTCNVLTMHSGFLHYQFNGQDLTIDFPAEVIKEETKRHIADAAKATGAFPFGLANRKIIVNKVFFDGFKQRMKDHYQMDINLQVAEGKNYVFNAVDGGAINNEPIGTTTRILDCKRELHKSDENYMILIDPFPTITNAAKRKQYEEPGKYTMLKQASMLLDAFRNQSMFKQEDLIQGLEMKSKRFLIYPTKRRFYFLACGQVGGFSGFLKKEFRQHDYQLGRKNCQAFLRFYFGEPLEKFEEVTGTKLTDDQVKKFRYNVNYGKAGVPEAWKIPLIPDMLVLQDDEEIQTPKYNGLTTNEINQINSAIENRINAIVDKTYPSIHERGKKVSWIVGLGMGILSGFIKGKIKKQLVGKTKKYMSDTFFPQQLKQDELLLNFLHQIANKGKLYQKTKGVWARVSEGAEEIVSKTGDGVETKNLASRGDYIVKNDTAAKEEYIVKPEKFHQRYVVSKEDYYVPNEKARVYALQLTADNIRNFRLEGLQLLLDDPQKEIYIEAPWSESQTLRLNDYLVIPLAKDEVYRIARKEFEETYALVK